MSGPLGASLAVIVVRLVIDKAIPGWPSYVTARQVVIMIQFLTIAIGSTFTTLTSRIDLSFGAPRLSGLCCGELRHLSQ